jgi:hypothetical protein
MPSANALCLTSLTSLAVSLLVMTLPSSAALPEAPMAYVSMDDFAAFFEAVVAPLPPHLRAATAEIGRSFEDRPISLVQVGTAGDHAVPAMLLTSMHHGREALGALVNAAFLRQLLQRFADGEAEAAALLRFRRFLLIPSVNPDAYAWNLGHPSDRMARKNRRPTCAGNSGPSTGVDLNRNYPFEWQLDNKGSSPSPCQDDYRGASAFSEPETVAVRDLLLSASGPGANVTVALNWHSFGRFVNVPFAVESRPSPPDAIYAALLLLARSMTTAMGPAYRFGHPWTGGLYTCNGEASDWMVDVKGVIAFSPELGPDFVDGMSDALFAKGMWPEASELPALVEEGVRGAWVAAWAAGSNVQVTAGALKPATGVPIACELPFVDEGGRSRSVPCSFLDLTGLALSNGGARAAVGAVRITAVSAHAATLGPMCVGIVCVSSLSSALAAGAAHGEPRCDSDVVSPQLLSSARGRQTGLRDGRGSTPLLSSAILTRVHTRARGLAGKSDRIVDTRRAFPDRVALDTVVEDAIAADQGADSSHGRRLADSASASTLGAAVWDSPGEVAAWSKLEGAAVPSLRLSVPVLASGDSADPCRVDAAGAVAFVAVSDSQMCSIYRLACETAAPLLVYRGPSGCTLCALFRHLPAATVGGTAPTPSASAVATPADANDAAWRDSRIRTKTATVLDGTSGISDAAWPWMLHSEGGSALQVLALCAGGATAAVALWEARRRASR